MRESWVSSAGSSCICICLYVFVFLVVVACVHCRRLRESWVSLSGFYLSSSQMQSGENKDDKDQS